MCLLQVRRPSNSIPKKRADWTYGTGIPSSVRGGGECLCLLVKIRADVFCGDRDSPQVFDHSFTASKAVCILAIAVGRSVSLVQRAPSSAYRDV